MPFNKDGVYIGILESYLYDNQTLSRHWTVQVKLEDKYSLPYKIEKNGDKIITNFKEYPVDLYIEGKISADGEFSLVSEI